MPRAPIAPKRIFGGSMLDILLACGGTAIILAMAGYAALCDRI